MTDRTALTAEEEDLRRFFMDRGWVIQMDDRPGQSVHPFADLAAALRTVIIEAKAQGRAAAHPPATVPSSEGDRLANALHEVGGEFCSPFTEYHPIAMHRSQAAGLLTLWHPPATVPDEGLRAAAAKVIASHRKGYWRPEELDALEAALTTGVDMDPARWHDAALSTTKAQEP